MRVTFWSEHGAACIVVEHGSEKVCCVTRQGRDSNADAALAEAAAGADLLIFPGDWEEGLALKQASGAKLLALCDPNGDPITMAERAAKESSNVFVALHKMRLDL